MKFRLDELGWQANAAPSAAFAYHGQESIRPTNENGQARIYGDAIRYPRVMPQFIRCSSSCSATSPTSIAGRLVLSARTAPTGPRSTRSRLRSRRPAVAARARCGAGAGGRPALWRPGEVAAHADAAGPRLGLELC